MPIAIHALSGFESQHDGIEYFLLLLELSLLLDGTQHKFCLLFNWMKSMFSFKRHLYYFICRWVIVGVLIGYPTSQFHWGYVFIGVAASFALLLYENYWSLALWLKDKIISCIIRCSIVNALLFSVSTPYRTSGCAASRWVIRRAVSASPALVSFSSLASSSRSARWSPHSGLWSPYT